MFAGKPGDRAAGKAASVFENTKFFRTNFIEPSVDLFAWGILKIARQQARDDDGETGVLTPMDTYTVGRRPAAVLSVPVSR